jgi:hypothetical protein
MKLIALTLGLAALTGPTAVNAQEAVTPGPGQAAAEAAGRDGKYLFVLFRKADDEATRAARRTLDTALAGKAGRAASVTVSLSDPADKPLVDRFGVGRSPMPLVLALAPNGAVTRAFPLKLTAGDIDGAFVSAGQAACLKAVQARKLVLVCVLPEKAEVPQGVREFTADARFGPATEVVTVRAGDTTEAALVKAVGGSADSPTTLTAVLAPPGNLVGTFSGAVTRQQLADKVTAPQGCCPGGKCGPNGCCGKK